MLNGLDLFSGTGAMSFALREWVNPLCYCEIDSYCQGMLLNRMADRKLEYGPIWDDIRTLSQYDLPKCIDILYGGFTCQDISIAGHGKGLGGERSGLFFEMLRLAKEIKPKFLFIENVSAISRRGGPTIARLVAELGYDCRWCTISAEGLMAPQKRNRWFFLAHSNSEPSWKTDKRTITDSQKQETWIRPSGQNWRDEFGSYWKKNKQPIPGMDYGNPFEVDRAKCLGNSVCPQQTREAFKILMGIK